MCTLHFIFLVILTQTFKSKVSDMLQCNVFSSAPCGQTADMQAKWEVSGEKKKQMHVSSQSIDQHAHAFLSHYNKGPDSGWQTPNIFLQALSLQLQK